MIHPEKYARPKLNPTCNVVSLEDLFVQPGAYSPIDRQKLKDLKDLNKENTSKRFEFDSSVTPKPAMDALLLVITSTCIWAPAHFYLSRADLKDISKWLARAVEYFQEDTEVKHERLEDEMMKARESNYKMFNRLCSHLGFLAGVFFLHEVYTAPSMTTIISAGISFTSYFQHLAVASGHITLSPQRLKFITYLLHILLLLVILCTAGAANTFQFVVLQLLQTSARFLLALACMEPIISIPFQLLYTLEEMVVYFHVFEEANIFWAPLLCAQLFILLGATACSIFLDLALRKRIQALLETADAESLVSSFRKLLRGVCDGEVLLDSELRVAKESECLKHLILTDANLKGRSFAHLLADKEEERFADFIKSSTSACEPEKNDAGAPLCLRISLRDSAGIRVGADIYHVAVPGLYGSNEAYHLIAFKEDPDCRPQPEASDDAIPAVLMNPLNQWREYQNELPRVRQGDSISMTSERSGSTGASSDACACACPELQEMTLLVDVETELQDVQEAHLRFRRLEESEEQPSAIQSSMPSLRKLLEPTEWPAVQMSVMRFANHAELDPQLQPKPLKRLALKFPGQCGTASGTVIVEEAYIKRFAGRGKVWLHLAQLHPKKPRRRQAFLEGISESLANPSRDHPSLSGQECRAD